MHCTLALERRMGICTGYKLACRLVITHPPKTMSPTTSDLKTKVQPTAVQELCAKKGGALREGGGHTQEWAICLDFTVIF